MNYMTIGMLIEELKKMDQNEDVTLLDEEGNSVFTDKHIIENVVVFVTKISK